MKNLCAYIQTKFAYFVILNRKTKKNCSHNIHSIVLKNNTVTSDPGTIANEFNEYFSTMFTTCTRKPFNTFTNKNERLIISESQVLNACH